MKMDAPIQHAMQVVSNCNTIVDVPNAFSPNGDGTNDVIYVQGFAISKMTWRIFNRWGQLIFTSSNINNGWDGRFKGELQPQDVYAYTLSIEFTDGTKLNKKGDITLLEVNYICPNFFISASICLFTRN